MPAEMRRLARYLFTLCSGVSLLLCVAVCVLWARSYRVDETVRWRTVRHHGQGPHCRDVDVSHGGGEVRFGRLSYPCNDGSAKHPGGSFTRNTSVTSWRRTLPALHGIGGYGWLWRQAPKVSPEPASAIFWIILPHWSLVMLGVILPGLYSYRFIRTRRRVDANCCPRCGYDLRASPERCPECGTLTAA
jgi:hypothetical protein